VNLQRCEPNIHSTDKLFGVKIAKHSSNMDHNPNYDYILPKKFIGNHIFKKDDDSIAHKRRVDYNDIYNLRFRKINKRLIDPTVINNHYR